LADPATPSPKDLLDAAITSLAALIELEVRKLEHLRQHRLGLEQLRKRRTPPGRYDP